jgi:hypothetical protein
VALSEWVRKLRSCTRKTVRSGTEPSTQEVSEHEMPGQPFRSLVPYFKSCRPVRSSAVAPVCLSDFIEASDTFVRSPAVVRITGVSDLVHLPVSQPSLHISPTWIPLISSEVSNSQVKVKLILCLN